MFPDVHVGGRLGIYTENPKVVRLTDGEVGAQNE
jgi:hypothetical protein